MHSGTCLMILLFKRYHRFVQSTTSCSVLVSKIIKGTMRAAIQVWNVLRKAV